MDPWLKKQRGPHQRTNTDSSPSPLDHLNPFSKQLNTQPTNQPSTPQNSLAGHVGSNDVDDLCLATDTALALQDPVTRAPLLDAARVGVVGGSHGGFLGAHAIAARPEVFKVAALRNPVTNIAAMVCEEEEEKGRKWHMHTWKSFLVCLRRRGGGGGRASLLVCVLAARTLRGAFFSSPTTWSVPDWAD